MMSKHTVGHAASYGEPWVKGGIFMPLSDRPTTYIYGKTEAGKGSGKRIAKECPLKEADRIVACVNACAGMEDPGQEIAALIEDNKGLNALFNVQRGLLEEIDSLQKRLKIVDRGEDT